MSTNQEIGKSILAGDLMTNYHDHGSGPPLLLIHGSGPGVTAWANWRLNIPDLARHFRVIAPDVVGFGYTERPAEVRYEMQTWIAHLVGLLDALDIESAHVLGNSFGGALALALAIRHPKRLRRLGLMGSVGVSFPLTEALDRVWGYTPSIESMRGLMDVFAYDRTLVTEELAQMRYEASIRPGCQEAFATMFPSPRQRSLDALASREEDIRALPHETIIFHGRDDKVIPLSASYRLFELIPHAQLHVFGRCGHWTQIEHRARFNRLATDFFSEAD